MKVRLINILQEIEISINLASQVDERILSKVNSRREVENLILKRGFNYFVTFSLPEKCQYVKNVQKSCEEKCCTKLKKCIIDDFSISGYLRVRLKKNHYLVPSRVIELEHFLFLLKLVSQYW